MHCTPLSGTSSPCNLLSLNLGVYGLVQATVGVGTVLIWDFSVAFTKGGGVLAALSLVRVLQQGLINPMAGSSSSLSSLLSRKTWISQHRPMDILDVLAPLHVCLAPSHGYLSTMIACVFRHLNKPSNVLRIRALH